MTDNKTMTFDLDRELTSDESTVCPVCNGSSAKCFTGTRGTVQQNTLGWLDTEICETFGLNVSYANSNLQHD